MKIYTRIALILMLMLALMAAVVVADEHEGDEEASAAITFPIAASEFYVDSEEIGLIGVASVVPAIGYDGDEFYFFSLITEAFHGAFGYGEFELSAILETELFQVELIVTADVYDDVSGLLTFTIVEFLGGTEYQDTGTNFIDAPIEADELDKILGDYTDGVLYIVLELDAFEDFSDAVAAYFDDTRTSSTSTTCSNPRSPGC